MEMNDQDSHNKSNNSLAKKIGTENVISIFFIVSLVLALSSYFYTVSFFKFPLAIAYYTLVTKANLLNYASTVFSIIKVSLLVFVIFPSLYLMIRLIKDSQINHKLKIPLLRKCTITQLVLILLFVTLILTSEFLLLIFLLTPVRANVDRFILTTKQSTYNELNQAVKEVVQYVDAHLNSSWGSSKAVLEIDNMLSANDYNILLLLGFHTAHIILYQKWGSCGEYAIVTAYLLNRLGFETRIARFANIDHSWAEVKFNESWYIVDPWYIGYHYENRSLVPIKSLASLFQGNHTIIVSYLNGTKMNASKEHGYK